MHIPKKNDSETLQASQHQAQTQIPRPKVRNSYVSCSQPVDNVPDPIKKRNLSLSPQHIGILQSNSESAKINGKG